MAAAGILFSVSLSPAFADTNRTNTQYTATTSGTTEVIPYLVMTNNYNLLVIDMQRDNFNNVEYIHYNLNYDTSDPGTQRGAQGTYYPWLPNVKSQIQYWGGKPFIRQYIPLGSCSQGVCHYDTKPTSLKVTVDTKYFNKAATDTTVVTVNH